jgi:hypothetical protein
MASKQDYEAAAKVLRETGAPLATVEGFADLFAADNTRFRREQFMEASGRPALNFGHGTPAVRGVGPVITEVTAD